MIDIDVGFKVGGSQSTAVRPRKPLLRGVLYGTDNLLAMNNPRVQYTKIICTVEK